MKKSERSTKRDEYQIYLDMLGKRLKELRLKKGYSNYENFAFENNIGRAQYGKYETGGNIQFDTLIRLIKIHQMTIREFFSEGFEE